MLGRIIFQCTFRWGRAIPQYIFLYNGNYIFCQVLTIELLKMKGIVERTHDDIVKHPKVKSIGGCYHPGVSPCRYRVEEGR